MARPNFAPPIPNMRSDEFLAHELARIRNAPENGPDETGAYTELFWALVVGLSKTKHLSLVPAIVKVHDFMVRKAPDARLPVTLNAGPERMKRLQAQLKAYRADKTFQVDYTNVNAEALWGARKAMLIVSAIMIGVLLLHHWGAQRDHMIYPSVIFVMPMILTICIAGVVDPRIVWAATKYGQNLPARYKLLGVCAAGAGLALSGYLAYLYGIWG